MDQVQEAPAYGGESSGLASGEAARRHGFVFSGSSVGLSAEHGHTWETSLSYTQPEYSLALSAYRLYNDNAIVLRPGGADDLGERHVDGADLNVQWRPALARPLSVWAMWSWMDSRQSHLDADAHVTDDETGDIPSHSIRAGLNWNAADALNLNLRSRWFASRDTVYTNPLHDLDSYQVWDLSLRSKPFAAAIFMQLTISNVLDESYQQPGVRRADAGNEPGYFDSEGLFHGAAGFFSSALPQPGRQWFLDLSWNFE